MHSLSSNTVKKSQIGPTFCRNLLFGQSIETVTTWFVFTSRKGAELGHMLLLSINRKAYIGNPLM